MPGKFARLLAKHNLFARLGFNFGEELFFPHPMELRFVTDVKSAYGKYPMGADGYAFIRAGKEDAALRTARSSGLKARIVGNVEEAKEGRTGVELKAFNEEEVYFSGRD
jgi:hypothetical protein